MRKYSWFKLDRFGEGGASGGNAGDGAGEGSATGVQAVDAGQQGAGDLNIPKDKFEKWAKSRERRGLTPVAATQIQGATAPTEAANTPPEREPKASWEQIKNDPDYKAEIDKLVSSVVRNRLAKSQATENAMAQLTPALTLLRAQYGIAEGDNEGLVKAVTESARSAQAKAKATELGVDMSTAERLVDAENKAAQAENNSRAMAEQQRISKHLQKLMAQGEELKGRFPQLNIEDEFNNEQFVKLTSPNIGMSFEDAYYAVHHAEIEQAQQRARESKAVEQVTQSIRAGQARPKENGSAAAAGIAKPLYSQMSKEQRAAALNYMKKQAALGQPRSYMDM